MPEPRSKLFSEWLRETVLPDADIAHIEKHVAALEQAYIQADAANRAKMRLLSDELRSIRGVLAAVEP